MKKEFESERIYHKQFLKTKIKTYGDEPTDFSDNEILKVGYNYTSLAVILIDFVLKKDEKYYRQVFLRESQYIEKYKGVIIYITNDLQYFSRDYEYAL